MQSLLHMMHGDTASNCSVGPPLCDHGTHTHIHTSNESLSHFSNPTIHYAHLSSILPSILPFSSFSILSPSVYSPYSSSIHLLWTHFHLFLVSHSLLFVNILAVLCLFSPFTQICSSVHPFCSMRYLLPNGLNFLLVLIPSALLLFGLSPSLLPPLCFCSQSDHLTAYPQLILTRLYLTSQPFSILHSLFYVSISHSYNRVPLFSVQGHSSSPLPSPLLPSPRHFLFICLCSTLLLILSSYFSLPPLHLPSSYISHHHSSSPPHHCSLPYEIVNHLSGCFCHSGCDRNRQANSLKYTWRTRTHASLICWSSTTRCIMHF